MNNFIKNIKNIIDNKELNGIKKRFEVGELINKEYKKVSNEELTKIGEQINIRGYKKSDLRNMVKLYKKYINKPKLFEYSKKIDWNANKELLKNVKNDNELEFYLKYGIIANWDDKNFKNNITNDFYSEYLKNTEKTEYKFIIDNILIKNYKALVNVEIKKPNNFLVFVGSNAAGKSTIFEALDFFNHSYKINGTDETFNIFGGVKNVLNYKQQEEKNNNLEVKIDLSDDFYSVKYNGVKQKDKQIKGELKKDTLFNKKLKTSFSRIFIDNIKRAKNRLNINSRLWLDAENLNKIIKNIFSNPELKEDFLSQLITFVPGLDNIDIKPDLTGTDELLIYEKSTKKPFKGTLISEGTYNIMSLLALIYQTAEQQFICIDEPEIGLNPYVLEELIKFFREMAKLEKHYIWLTTHSQTIVSLLKEDELILVDKNVDTGETTLKQFKEGDFNNKKADKAWLTNELGGGLPW